MNSKSTFMIGTDGTNIFIHERKESGETVKHETSKSFQMRACDTVYTTTCAMGRVIVNELLKPCAPFGGCIK